MADLLFLFVLAFNRMTGTGGVVRLGSGWRCEWGMDFWGWGGGHLACIQGRGREREERRE